MDTKQEEELLAEIHRNCEIALQSISNLLPEVEDETVRQELKRQHEEYEKISSKAAAIAKDRGIELKSPGPFKKAMLWSSIKINAMTDGSRAHLSEMMTQGTVMGITALKSTLADRQGTEPDETDALAKELLALEESFEKIWKSLIV